jgi:hypothetical protein
LGAVVFAALVLAVQERDPRKPNPAKGWVQSGSELLLNVNPAARFTIVGLNGMSSTDKTTSGQASSVNLALTEFPHRKILHIGDGSNRVDSNSGFRVSARLWARERIEGPTGNIKTIHTARNRWCEKATDRAMAQKPDAKCTTSQLDPIGEPEQRRYEESQLHRRNEPLMQKPALDHIAFAHGLVLSLRGTGRRNELCEMFAELL